MVETVQSGITREAVLSEIEGWKKNPHEGYTWHSFLNNFHCYLPSVDYADKGGSNIGYICQNSGLLDTKNYNFHQGGSARHHSKLFLNQTPREFLEEINRTIDNLPDISLAEIKRLQHMHYKINNIHMSLNMSHKEEKRELEKIDKSMEIIKTLYEYALPVYVELRVKGYSHFDLTG